MDDLIKVYGASWCPDCRRAKRFLGDQRISFEWHDIEVDPDGVRTVQERNNGNNVIPTIIFPDGSHLAEPSNEELAERIGLERMAMMHVYDLIIVGGGPAGLTTSIYAARENLQTLVIDSKGLGGQAGVTERLDNYPGFPEGIGGAELADRIVLQAQRYGVEMLQAVSVKSGATEELHPAGAFVFIGLDPNTGFVKGSVDLDDRGLIVTDMGLQTSMPGVFAAGDVRSGSTKQLASAVGEGAAAAIGIRRYLEALDAKLMHMM